MLPDNFANNWLAELKFEDTNSWASRKRSLCRRPLNFSGLLCKRKQDKRDDTYQLLHEDCFTQKNIYVCTCVRAQSFTYTTANNISRWIASYTRVVKQKIPYNSKRITKTNNYV